MPKTSSLISTVFIIGAGFSKCAGIPIQAEFSSLLLADEFSSELDKAITSTLKDFLKDVFGWREGCTFPSLEDIFTCVDLSASTGHHLSIKYTPKLLRAIRRMAIYRIFSVLDRHFYESPEIERLLSLYASEPLSIAFVVLNWDIVLEKHLAAMIPPILPDYACQAFNWDPSQNCQRDNRMVPVCKMHGSSNWVYCENCKSIFYNLDKKLSLKAKVGLIKADFRLFAENFTDSAFDSYLGIAPEERQCRFCHNMISSHIATFSYRKSFRTHAYSSIWYTAEKMLSDADHWVFVGYSLPKADYELKHLLKVAELRMRHRRQDRRLTMDVVVKGDSARPDYEAFFGKNTFTYWSDGLEGYVSSKSAIANHVHA